MRSGLVGRWPIDKRQSGAYSLCRRERSVHPSTSTREGPPMTTPYRHTLGRALFVALVAGVIVGAGVTSLFAQQPPPTWKQGQPDVMKESTLAPVPQPPAPLAAEKIPLNKIKVQPGFKVELWASGLTNARP